MSQTESFLSTRADLLLSGCLASLAERRHRALFAVPDSLCQNAAPTRVCITSLDADWIDESQNQLHESSPRRPSGVWLGHAELTHSNAAIAGAFRHRGDSAGPAVHLRRKRQQALCNDSHKRVAPLARECSNLVAEDAAREGRLTLPSIKPVTAGSLTDQAGHATWHANACHIGTAAGVVLRSAHVIVAFRCPACANAAFTAGIDG